MDYEKALADGHSPEEVGAELARRGAVMDYKKALADGHDTREVFAEMNKRIPAPKTGNSDDGTASTDMSNTKGFLIGAGGGLLNTYKGAQALAYEGAGKVTGSKDLQKKSDEIRSEIAENRKVLEPLKNANTGAAVGEIAGETAPWMAIPGGAAGGFVRRAVESAAVGAAQGAVSTDNPIEGAVTGAIASLGLSGASKVLNGLMGRVPKNLITELAEKYHIPLSLGDITGKGQRAETMLERAPSFLGLSGFRAKQNEASGEAARTFLGKYIIDPASADIAETNRRYADGLYAALRVKVNNLPVQDILPEKTRETAVGLLDRYPQIFKKFQDTRTENLINDIVHGTSPVETPAGRILGTDGLPLRPAVKTPKTLTFEEAWELRKGLGEKIGQARKLELRGDLDKTAVSQMKALFASLTGDLENWTEKIGRPDIMKNFKDANEAYKNFVIKHDVVQRAYDKAMGTVGAGEFFSPKTFSTALKKIAYNNDAFKTFSPGEVKEMTGLANIMQVVKRSGQFMENRPTSDRWAGLGIGTALEGTAWKIGGAAAALKTAGTAGAAALVAKFLTTTKAGKNIMLAGATLEPESRGMKMLVEQVYKMIPRMTVAAGQTNNFDRIMGIEQ